MIDHELRRLGIGGSEVAAILGLDDWRDGYTVWAEKKGLFEREQPTARMMLGKYFERAIIECYADLTGRAVEFRDKTERSTIYPWMVYSPDAVCVNEPRGIDAKFVAFDQRFKWGPTRDDIPDYIQLQCYWYLIATGFERWDVAAVVSENTPLIYTFERDAWVEEQLIEASREFYERYLIGDEVPRPGSSEQTARALRYRFPRNRVKPREATPEEFDAIASLASVRQKLKVLDAERRQLENELKLAIGDSEGLRWPTGRVTWKVTKDSTVVDYESIATGLLPTVEEETRNFLIEQATRTKPGSRRFLLQGKVGGLDVTE